MLYEGRLGLSQFVVVLCFFGMERTRIATMYFNQRDAFLFLSSVRHRCNTLYETPRDHSAAACEHFAVSSESST